MTSPVFPFLRPLGARLPALAFGLAVFAPVALAGTQPFQLAITAPAANATLPTGAPATVSASVSGNANPIAKVEFYEMASGTLLATDSSAPYSVSWTPPAAGTVFLRATGYDSTGQKANSTVTTVKIVAGTTATPPPAEPPSSNPPAAATPAAALTVSTASVPAAVDGVPYSQTLAATGGTPPYSWKLASGAFPNGLVLSAAGVISGTPVATGSWMYSYPFSAYVTVTDSAGASVGKVYALPISASGSTPPSTPPPTTQPPATYTVAVNNGTLSGGATSGSFAAGATVTVTANPAPAGQWFKVWTGLVAFADASAASTTFTMPASSVSVNATYFAPPALVPPVAGHPRLWINQSDLPRLRSWAVSTNPVYQQGLRGALATALSAYKKCFPNGQPASPYPDLGDIYGYAGAQIQSADLVSEHHALVLAFFALIDPDPAARADYAAKARQLFMHVIDEAAKGHAAGAPFRDPIFALFNRTHTVGEAWPLITDWLQGVTDAGGQPVAVLGAADKATIRQVFMMWSADCLNAYICGGDHPAPVGVTNSPALLPGGNAHRVAANNYYSSHARLITMLPLALDAADDAPLDTTKPAGLLGNTLRSYLPNATGAWLYQQFALYGDAAAVRQALGLPATANVGLSSGGLPVEGNLYGHSYAYVLGELLSLQTAGIADPAVLGPQGALLTAPVWDRFAEGFITQMVNAPFVPAGASYLGPVYQMSCYGDILRTYVTNQFMQGYALLALLRAKQGDPSMLNTARWFATHAINGGSASLLQRVANPWNTSESILSFLLFDPAAPAPVDPRPGYATAFVDAPQARLVVRSDWAATGTLFSYRAAPASINHVNNDAGQFELWRDGEWLTKELSNYDNFGNGQSTLWHNTLALKNWCSAGTPNLNYFEANYFPNGSGWNNGLSQGDPVSVFSVRPGYVCVQTDLTKLYNRPSVWTPANALLDITHASRTLVHLRNDRIVVYDRADSVHTGLFKRFNLNFTAAPSFTVTPGGTRATAITPKGQRLHLTTLLPAGASVKWMPSASLLTNVAELDNVLGRVEVEAPGLPAYARFLHVVQAATAAAPAADPAAVVVSSAGTPYEGALVMDTVVMFARDLAAPFASLTYSVPDTTAHHYVTGLKPGAPYAVAVQSAGGYVTVTVTPGGASLADEAGALAF